MKHRWFAGFDWGGLIEKKVTPPILPLVLNNLDASNFESYQLDELDGGDDPEDLVDWSPSF